VNADAIADRKRRQIALLLFFLDDVNDAIHKFGQPRDCGRTLSFGEVDFATRIRAGQGHRELEHESDYEQEATQKLSVKIYGICG
jgi:hypothetical protein